MNKKLLVLSLFLCGCIPTVLIPLPWQVNVVQISSSPSTQTQISVSPTINPSLLVVSPTPTPSPTAVNSLDDTSTSPNSSPVISNTIKLNISISYANLSIGSQTKSVTVIITDQYGKTTTANLDIKGGIITIPKNTTNIILNAINNSNNVISTINQNISFMNDTVLQVTFSSLIKNGSSGGGAGSSGGGVIPNPDIPVTATIKPDQTSVK